MPEAIGFKTGNVVERDEVHAAMIKAIPAAPERSLTEARRRPPVRSDPKGNKLPRYRSNFLANHQIVVRAALGVCRAAGDDGRSHIFY